jgi:hypothetical protein
LSEPRKPLRIALFVLMVIAVGWLDLFFFDRAVPLLLWFVLSGAAVIAGWHFLARRRE